VPVLYFMDSGDYAPKNVGGYAWIHPNQVGWFISEAKKYASIPALAFFLIPLPEYHDVWWRGKVSGIKNERICSPKMNSGLFTALLESGDVMGTFVGHDHDNDFCGKLHGISLCYGRITGYNVYGDLKRGARVIQMYEGKKSSIVGFNLVMDKKFQPTLIKKKIEIHVKILYFVTNLNCYHNGFAEQLSFI